jgi:hypothetical protein
MIDLDDYREEYAAALEAVSDFEAMSRSGQPPDRWATTAQMPLIARGIRALADMSAMQSDYIKAMSRACNEVD